ncbi:hypothetical protein EMCRGX_G005545 [Ephydatia muelleri]
MSTLRLQPPESFDYSKSDGWPRWRRRFEQFRNASGLSSDKDDVRQVSTLLYCLRQICFPGSKAIISAIWMHVEEAETKAIRKVKCGAVKEELKFRDMEVNGKLKLELERGLANLCKGIANFPALLQPCPDTAL